MIEIRRSEDGRIQARRKDGKPLTEADRERARELARTSIERSLPAGQAERGLKRTYEPERSNPDALTATAQVLAEFASDEAGRIVALWREILGVKLDPERVKEHLENLRKWQAEWHRTSKVGTSPA